MRTATFSFGGANIKGQPPMPAKSVRNDVRKISKVVDVFCTQEFRHAWYWTTIRSVLGLKWRSFPSFGVGAARPTYGGQAIFWKRKLFRKVVGKVSEAFDFSLDNAGIMENRWIRSVLLACKKTSMQCWFVSTHFVVHGDDRGEGERRQKFMHQNLKAFDKMIGTLCRTDSPIIFEGDLNIHPNTWAYSELMRLVSKYKGRLVGVAGVEYLIIFDRHCDTKVVVTKNYSLAPKKFGLKTDHEIRCIDFHLQN